MKVDKNLFSWSYDFNSQWFSLHGGDMTPEISRKLNAERRRRNREARIEMSVANFERLYDDACRQAEDYLVIMIESDLYGLEDLFCAALQEWKKWNVLATGYYRTLEVVYYS